MRSLTFLDFPKSIVLEVLSNWLHVWDICKVDSAYCNSGSRNNLLALLSRESVTFNGLGGDHFSRLDIYQHYSRWLETRQLSVKHFTFTTTTWNEVRQRIPIDRLSSVHLHKTLLTVEDITRLFELFPRLEDVEFTNCRLAALPGSTEPTLNFKPMRKIEIDQCKNMGYVLKSLMSDCSNLEFLSVSKMCDDYSVEGAWIPIEDIISAENQTYPKLHTAVFKACGSIKDTALCLFTGTTPALTSLSVSNCTELADECLDFIADCPLLTEFDCENCTNLCDAAIEKLTEGCPLLSILNLSGCTSLSNAAVDSVSDNCLKITSIDLSKCEDLTCVSLIYLAESCPQLTYINLSDVSQLSSECIVKIAESCSELTFLSASVKERSIFAPDSTSHFEKMTATDVIYVLQNCPKIEHLTIRTNYPVPAAVPPSLFQPALCPNLRTLDLYKNTMKATHVMVCYMVDCAPNLTFLSLGVSRKITDNTISFITNKCPKLRHVSLNGCFKVHDASVISIARNCRDLEVLKLHACPNLTRDFIPSLREFSKKLHTLDTQGCDVSVKDVKILLRHCPLLRNIKLSHKGKYPEAMFTKLRQQYGPKLELASELASKFTWMRFAWQKDSDDEDEGEGGGVGVSRGDMASVGEEEEFD